MTVTRTVALSPALAAAIIGLLTLSPPAAIGATLPATLVTINAVLQTAKPGDKVVLSGSGYVQVNNSANPMLDLQGVVIDASGLTGAVFYAANVKNFTLKGGQYLGTNWKGGIYIAGYANVTVDAPVVVGGLTLMDGQNVLVQNAVMTAGPVFIRTTKAFRVTGTKTTGADADGIDIDPCSSYGRVDHNLITSSNAKNGAHPDAVQLQNGTKACPDGAHYVEIDHNRAEGATAGYDAWGNSGYGGGVGLYVHDNEVFNNYSWGGALDNCKSCVLADNHVGTLAGAPWPSSFDSRGSTDIVRCGNVIDRYTSPAGRTWPGGKEASCTAAQKSAAAALAR